MYFFCSQYQLRVATSKNWSCIVIRAAAVLIVAMFLFAAFYLFVGQVKFGKKCRLDWGI